MSEIITTEDVQIARENAAFEMLQRQAKMFSASTLVPKDFQGNIANCAIAINIAKRLGTDPFMTIQNVDIIHGRPSFRATFLIAMVNSAGRFEPLQFKMEGEEGKPSRSCVAWTKSKPEGTPLEGPKITLEMAKVEGWSTKNGSKWQTMPELMLRYRAAAFFARLYAPDITLGMMTAEEVSDVVERDVTPPSATESKLFKTLAATSPQTSAPPVSVHQDSGAGETLSLNSHPDTVGELITNRMTIAGVSWPDVYGVLADQGFTDAGYVPLNEASHEVISTCLAQFDKIVAIVKGGR